MVASSCFITDLVCWPSVMSKSVSSTSFPDKCKYRLITKKKHKSAYELGKQDANCNLSDCHLYITQHDKGFGDHSTEFNKNYIKGACEGHPDGVGSDSDQATYTCGDDNN